MFCRNKGRVEFADQWITGGAINETLEAVNKLVNWSAIRGHLESIYAPREKTGRPGYDAVMLLKLLILEHWYELSDNRVLEESADRLSFRKFLGLGVGDALPNSTTLVKFRNRLRENDVLDEVFEYVNACIQNSGYSLKTGKIVDATLVKAAVRPRKDGSEKEIEPDADKTVKNGKPHYGYKVHMATDVETNTIQSVEVTPSSHADTTVFEELLDGDEPQVLADKGYPSKTRRDWLKKRRIDDKIMHKAARGRPLSEKSRQINKKISKVRGAIERKFGEMKKWHGMHTMRYIGLSRAKLQVILVAIVTNLKFLANHCA